MRDWSHGKARRETIKDYGSYRLRVDGALRRITGRGIESFGFAESEIRDHMPHMNAAECADLLLRGTDYYRTT